jgi:DNA repair ATPase RecN
MTHQAEIEARRIISAVQQDEEVRDLLAEIGYGEEKIGRLEKLLEGSGEPDEGRGSSEGVSQASESEWEKASEAYQALRRISSETFKNDPDAMEMMGTRLGQGTPISRKIKTDLKGARAFYDNILNSPDLIEQLEEEGYTRERLEEERDLLERALETGDEEVHPEVEKWVEDFKRDVEPHLEKRSNLREKLGL